MEHYFPPKIISASITWLRTATFPKSTYAMRPSRIAKTLPGCGSPWNSPNSSNCRRAALTPTVKNPFISIPASLIAWVTRWIKHQLNVKYASPTMPLKHIHIYCSQTCGSVHRIPSIHSITRTREPESCVYTRGILTVGSSLKFSKKSSMLRASWWLKSKCKTF